MGFGWKKQFEDTFSDGTVGLSTIANGDSITETGGKLRLASSASDIRWEAVNFAGPLAYKELSAIRESSTSAYIIYGKIISGGTLPAGSNRIIFAWTPDSNTHPGFGINFTPTVLTRQSKTNTTAWGSLGSLVSGSDVDWWVKIYWNVSGSSLTTQEGDSIPNNNYRTYYSTNGSTFSVAQSNTVLPFTPSRLGLALYSAAGVSTTANAEFEFIEFWEWAELDLEAPELTDISPSNGQVDVYHNSTISFSITDEFSTDLSSLVIYINGTAIYSGSFISGWANSTITANGSNGYDVVLIKDTLLGEDDALITVRVVVSDNADNTLDTSWSFTLVHIDSQVSFKFAVPHTRTILSPNVVHHRNQYDEHGALVSLERNYTEENWQYARRIRDTMVNLANSSYRGLINGITRELGLQLYDALRINPRVDASGHFLAPDPLIKFDGIWLLLYSDYANDILDWAIDRYTPGGNFEHLGDLVAQVNTTAFFEARLAPGISLQTRSMVVLNQTNRREVRFERVQASTRFKLKHRYVVPGSVFFSNRNLFVTEVANASNVLRQGQYSVDYSEGIVDVFSTPSSSDTVRYSYSEYPFSAIASPVIIYDINNTNFRSKMFSQVLREDGTYVDGAPTETGVDIINELYSVRGQYYGK